MTNIEFENELNTRITQVESGIQDVRKFTKRDYIEVGIVALICLIGIIVGAFI